MVTDNHIALDYLLASQGGVCALANTSCCFYINSTGQIEADVQTILKHATWLWNFNLEGMKDIIWNTIKQAFPNLTWFLPLLDRLITLILPCIFGPCIMNKLTTFLSSQIQAIHLQMMIQQGYQLIHQNPLDQATWHFHSTPI